MNLWWSGLIGVRMPATVPLRYRGPREVNPLRGSAKDQGVGLPCPDRDSHPSEVGRRAGPGTLSRKGRRWSASATGDRCGVADGPVLLGGVTSAGTLSGPCGGELVAVELSEIVRCHQ